MEVVRKRLFTDIGNTEIIAEVARQQAALFRKFRESLRLFEKNTDLFQAFPRIREDRTCSVFFPDAFSGFRNH